MRADSVAIEQLASEESWRTCVRRGSGSSVFDDDMHVFVRTRSTHRGLVFREADTRTHFSVSRVRLVSSGLA